METDYLIVGAGAAGLAFADTLLDETDATITLVDRRAEVGGHWRDAYPFVRLHLSSALYGVNSTPLGDDQRQTSGRNAGFYEQATGAEVCAYFDRVLHERLEASGRVTFLGAHDHLGEEGTGAQAVRDLAADRVIQVHPRRRIVDARYLEASIPATHRPSFTVTGDVRCVPVNDLPRFRDDHDHFTILGGGKTSFDACLWLLDHGVEPDDIRWIRSREMWLTDRAGMQPLDDVGILMDGLSRETEACAELDRPVDILQRLEELGRFLRLDETRLPTRWVGTMVSRPEVDSLREIADVIRLGHITSIDADRLSLTEGTVPARRSSLYVDCSATGLNPNPPRPVFAGDRITIQNVRHNSPSFNAALIAWVEAHREEREKNRLTAPNRYVSDASDAIGVHCRSWMTEAVWRQIGSSPPGSTRVASTSPTGCATTSASPWRVRGPSATSRRWVPLWNDTRMRCTRSSADRVKGSSTFVVDAVKFAPTGDYSFARPNNRGARPGSARDSEHPQGTEEHHVREPHGNGRPPCIGPRPREALVARRARPGPRVRG